MLDYGGNSLIGPAADNITRFFWKKGWLRYEGRAAQFLALMIVLGSGEIVRAETPPPQILTNGGFEENNSFGLIPGWTMVGNSSLTSVNVLEGERAIRIDSGYLLSAPIIVQGGGILSVEAWSRNENCSQGEAGAGVHVYAFADQAATVHTTPTDLQ